MAIFIKIDRLVMKGDKMFSENLMNGFAMFEGSGDLTAFFALIIGLALSIIIVVYVYHAIAWYTIARKMKYQNPFLAWIPFASTAMRLQMGGFHWALAFLYLIPILGWLAIFVLLTISHWRIFEKRKYPGWFSLSWIIPRVGGVLYLIVIGLVAWKDRKKMMFD